MQTTNEIHLQSVIPTHLAGMRLDVALSKLFGDYSRERLKKWIQEKRVLLNAQPCLPRDKVKTGDRIRIDVYLEPDLTWQAQAIHLNILYEDDELLVIDKPAGVIVHPGAGIQSDTLLNALLHHVPNAKTLPRAGIIHRLDKDTSGLLVVAKTLTTHHYLIKLMQQRKIQREYLAIVNGVMTAGGTIATLIGRHPIKRTLMAVTSSGKPAITHYRIIEKFKAHTYIKVQLETGRTHQIRVHMAHIQYPIVGDKTYGRKLLIPKHVTPCLIAQLKSFLRQALHAHQLSFEHPIHHEWMTFSSPLPNDMAELLSALKEDKEKSHD